MKKLLLFGLLVTALLVPWPVNSAHHPDPVDASTYPVTVTPASSSLTPSVGISGGASGSVQPGGLYYIDTANTSMDVSFILFFANTDDLAAAYRSLAVQVGLSARNPDGSWTPVTNGISASGNLSLDLHSNSVQFTVSGYQHYKVSVIHGSYTSSASQPGKPQDVRPVFYLTPST